MAWVPTGQWIERTPLRRGGRRRSEQILRVDEEERRRLSSPRGVGSGSRGWCRLRREYSGLLVRSEGVRHELDAIV